MNENIQIHKFDSRDELFSTVANNCEELLKSDLDSKGKASFIIPGGTTPEPVFAQLSNQLTTSHHLIISIIN